MRDLVQHLYLIPLLPLLAAVVLALARQSQRRLAASLAIGAMGLSFLLACVAFGATLGADAGTVFRQTYDFAWFQFGDSTVRLGWVLDPLTACLLVMVTFVGMLIFIYSVGYMAHDENFTRFFGFLALFAAAMLGVVIANSLLLLFICWELVGFASYILIGFWYQKPSAAAAAKKAFLTTRIGDLGFFVGLLWLYAQTGTLLCYDGGNGCLEDRALTQLATGTTVSGLTLSTAIALLLFWGAMGKSGQVPLHVWLPDAMEGPTPVSALIHAATMVAAGVFLIARVYPLLSAGEAPGAAVPITTALQAVTWVGAITAAFAASIAVAQNDIKRILAYSTVSQLGYMFMGLGMGGVAVGVFHLITHAFFKALLFLGAGSVIHGSHGEQDIRCLGGLRRLMPVTFATYAVGMMALAGVPLLFSGFWSKDEILHAAQHWPASRWPFYLGLLGALLTAFYMTRQVCYVFFGKPRGIAKPAPGAQATPVEEPAKAKTLRHEKRSKAQRSAARPARAGSRSGHEPHESPSVMTIPLVVLAVCAVVLGFLGTPAWPWFQTYLSGRHETVATGSVLLTMLISIVVAGLGFALGWLLYGRQLPKSAEEPDALERLLPAEFDVLRHKFYVDELYDATVVWLHAAGARWAHWVDRVVVSGLVQAATYGTLGLSWLSRCLDEYVVNLGFDGGCGSLRHSSGWLARLQNGQVQRYLRVLALSLTVLLLLLLWGCRL